MSDTINNVIPFVPEATIDPAAGLNLALNHIDAILQVAVIGIEDDPPSSSSEGDRYLIGTPPSGGVWEGYDDQIARYLNSTWTFHDTVRFVLNLTDNKIYVNSGSSLGWFSLETSGSARYSLAFDSADLDSTGGLTVPHNLGRQYVSVVVYDENGRQVRPDYVDVSGGINSCYVGLGGHDIPSSGGWNLVAT